MTELTVLEIAKQLDNMNFGTVKSRIKLLGIKPVRKVGRTNIYDPKVVEQIKNAKPVGRPKLPSPSGLTIQDVADKLKIPYKTAHLRIKVAGLTELTNESIESIRYVKKGGRPRKLTRHEAAKPVSKGGKTKKTK